VAQLVPGPFKMNLPSDRLDQSEAFYRQLLSRDPDNAGAMNNLANVLKDSGRIEEAVEMCRQALALDPNNAAIHSSLCYKVHFHPGFDRAAIFRELCEWNRRHAKSPPQPPAIHDPSPDRRLRIGYVSPDFYGHAECFFVLPLFKSHDRKQFEIHCYSSVRIPDKATEYLKSLADVWHDVADKSDEQLADKIRADQIDILVDLTMHMAFNRLLVFARKPAPVQVTWLAYPGGTGLDAIDYRLTDSVIDPAAVDTFYSEKSVRLPDCWCCYDPLGDVPSAAIRSEGTITFGSLNHPCKLNKPTLELWAKVLRNVPGSNLLLLSESEHQRRVIWDQYSQHGIDASRIQFTPRLRRREYLRLYDRIDIALDPLVYNGITTTCDALWMGVPVMTHAGNTGPGRAGLSLLTAVGLPDLIADSDEQFVSTAVKLAGDPTARGDFRKSLRGRMTQSPLMDSKGFARNVELGFREMWKGASGVFSTANPHPCPPPEYRERG
jgi:protein O-GlcNAc transferase